MVTLKAGAINGFIEGCNEAMVSSKDAKEGTRTKALGIPAIGTFSV